MIEVGRSIRVTGAILYVDTKAQWFLIGDPLAKIKLDSTLKQTNSKSSHQARPCRRQTAGHISSTAGTSKSWDVIAANATNNDATEPKKHPIHDNQQKPQQRQNTLLPSRRVPPSLLRSDNRKLVPFKRKIRWQ